MKKTLAVLWSIVFAAALVSCSLFETESEMGTVVVDLSGNARSADPATGLPILGTDGVFTHIRIFDEADRELLFSIQNSASASVMLAVGTRITISVDIVTDNARWHGEGVHTVGSGSNTVSLKINKVPASADKVLLWQKDSNSFVFYAADEWMLQNFTDSTLPPVIADSTHLPEGLLAPNAPTEIFCFDRSGNLYIVFKESTDYFLAKYAALADGGWDMHAQIKKLKGNLSLTAIAVDSSNSRHNRLYVAFADGPNPHLYVYSFAETQFQTNDPSNGLEVDDKDGRKAFFDDDTVPNELEIRALAADENGLFAVVETKPGLTNNRDISVKHCSTNLMPKSGSMALFTDVNPKHVTADLCIKNGVLYAAGSLFRATFISGIKRENFTSGKLWKLGQSSSFEFNAAQELWESFSDESAKEEGYAPYKFNTGKQNKLITASDGCYAKDLASPPPLVQNKDAVLIFNIENGALIKRQKINTKFAKELRYIPGPDIFEWK
ncbi:hypothetical protein [Treponema lecithinolyticum]